MFQGEARPCLPKTHIAEKKKAGHPKGKERLPNKINIQLVNFAVRWAGMGSSLESVGQPWRWQRDLMADHGINPTIHRSVLRTAHKVRTEDSTPQVVSGFFWKKSPRPVLIHGNFRGTLSQVGLTNPAMTGRLFRAGKLALGGESH